MKRLRDHGQPLDGACRQPVLLATVTFCALAVCAAPAWSQDEEGRVLSLSAGLSLTNDSNVARAPSDESVQRRFRQDGRNDTYLKGSVGFNFDRLISQQRLQADAQLDGYKYNNYSDFDNIGYRAGINYDWVIGRPLFGKIGANAYQYEPMIQDGQFLDGTLQRNRINRQFVYFNGGLRFTPSLSLIAGFDLTRFRNRLFDYKQNDNDRQAAEGGLRYAPGNALELDFVYRQTTGDYKNRQLQNFNGERYFGEGISNDFDQRELLLRATYRPAETTRFTGVIGQTQRDYDERPERDFSGLTLRAEAQWPLTGLTDMFVMVANGIEPYDGVWIASYAETTEAMLRPKVRLTGRITMSPYVNWIRRDYQGELGSGPMRADRLWFLGLEAEYQLTRTMFLVGELAHQRRSSNYDYANFKANIVTLGVRATF